MTLKPPSTPEEEYFAKQEAEKRKKLALEKQRELQKEEREKLRQLHFMRCPKCGMELETITFRGVHVDRCYGCNGTWLDEGELEALAGAEAGFMQKLISVFK